MFHDEVDQDTRRSKGYGFVSYVESEDAKKALSKMNGFELEGRAMKVRNKTEFCLDKLASHRNFISKIT